MNRNYLVGVETSLAGILVLCALWLLATPVPAAEVTAFPRYFDARYTLNRQGLDIAEIHWRLAPLKDRSFRFTGELKTIGIAKRFRNEKITEISDWRFSQGRLQSLRYRYSRSSGKRNREAEAEFDWTQGLIHNTLNGKKWSIPLPSNIYDKLNYSLALMYDVGRNLRLEHYQVADGAKLKVYDLRYLGEERIDTALGPLQALLVERTVKGNNKISRVWAAKSLHYLPVKIEHRENRQVVTLTITELKALDGYR